MKNNEIKFIENQIKYVPKTYEQFVLEEKKLGQQDLYPELDYEEVGEKERYGPCGSSKCTCYLSQGFVPLNAACPACGGTTPHQWVHSYCWGSIYISRNLRIQCMDCYASGHWKDWSYRCERHQQHKEAASTKAFLTALNIAAGMNATDDGTISIISEIAIKLIQEGRNS